MRRPHRTLHNYGHRPPTVVMGQCSAAAKLYWSRRKRNWGYTLSMKGEKSVKSHLWTSGSKQKITISIFFLFCSYPSSSRSASSGFPCWLVLFAQSQQPVLIWNATAEPQQLLMRVTTTTHFNTFCKKNVCVHPHAKLKESMKDWCLAKP